MTNQRHRPPRLAEFLVAVSLPRDIRDAVLGDLAEGYRHRAETHDPVTARRWYWSHAVGTLNPIVRFPFRLAGPFRQKTPFIVRMLRRRGNTMQSVLQDIRYGLRNAIKNPVFTLVVVLTLGLGIGANTAIFTVVDAIMLRPLAYPDPDRLVTVWADYTRRGGPLREWPNYPALHDLAQETDVFEAVGMWSGWNPTLTEIGNAEILSGAQFSAGMFSRVLRVPPALGRAVLAEDDEPGAPGVVLLSHGFWSRAFGEDPEVLGTGISLNGNPYTVIGVMPAGFLPPFVPNADVWRPIRQSLTNNFCGRGNACLRSFARMQPGVRIETARARADALGARMELEFPQFNTGVGYALFPAHGDLVRQSRAALWVLLGAVGFVLLIACVNVANLLLARTTARQAELAVRAALGAERTRLTRQLFTESAVLAVLGGALGIAVAVVGTDSLVALAPPGTPRIGEVAVDARILAFAGGITVIATLLFGLLPALRASHTDLQEVLKAGGRGQSGGGHNVRNGLVVGQVAIALMLLVGSGLLLRSLKALNSVDLGFEPDGLVALQLGLPSTSYPDREATTTFFRGLEERLGALPGVESVGAVNSLPLTANNGDVDFLMEGRPVPPPGEANITWFRRATASYFETMGIRLVQGRAFTTSDDREAPRVVIINQTLAERYYPDRDPVGQRINVNGQANPVWRQIVGVAQDVKNFGIQLGSRNAMYAPYYQVSTSFMTLVMRTSSDTDVLIETARGVVAEMDPHLAASRLSTMDEIVQASLGPDRFVTLLLSGFAAVAFLLAVVGLYGVVSYGVNQRIREMGVRIALGAADADIRKLIVGRSLALVGIGLAVGLVGGLAMTRLMEGLLFGVSATDPATFAIAAVLFGGVAAAASAIPAQRAVRVEPISVLREE
ncbi:MAG: ADOP family duplicated permease [Gemmatimonadetes bacterium]|nr:ADOP family duplicated permease [Gemmatimonadota bacterium]